MTIYIKGMGNISPQKSWDDETALTQAFDYRGTRLQAIEPDYAQWIDAKNLRRMSRIIRMGVTAAKMAMKESGLDQVDGIITGTGFGCLDDTASFLTKIITLNEEALNPTPFIQSTHNTIGSQIALLIQCRGYNQTYVDEAFAFEHALLDAMMGMGDNPDKHLLVGGVDEVTEISHLIQSRFGIFRQKLASTLNLFKLPKRGTVHGEGAAYFVVHGKKDHRALACIDAVTMLYKPDAQQLHAGIVSFIGGAGIKPGDIDLVLIGKSGDKETDAITDRLCSAIFPGSGIGLYKHLSGEHPSATAFALWLATRILVDHHIPEAVVYKHTGKPLRRILIYNPHFEVHHSLILVRSCRDTM